MERGIRRAMRRLGGKPSIALASAVPVGTTFALMRALNSVSMAAGQLRAVAGAIGASAPCNLLVFGVGNDSGLWWRLNEGGRTLFVEDNAEWARAIGHRYPGIPVQLVEYGTRLSDWQLHLEEPDELRLDLGDDVRAVSWDVVLVDGPTGWKPDQPGRMASIVEASRLVNESGCVFVHDCQRDAEQAFSESVLPERRWVMEGRTGDLSLHSSSRV